MTPETWVFDYPAAFLLLCFFIPFIYIKYIWKKRGGRFLFAFSNWNGKGFSASVNGFTIVYVVSQIMSLLGLAFIVVGLAGPVKIVKERVFISQGIDIMLVLDVSPSMAVQDFAGTSRLTSMQETVRRFVERRNNDSIGLVAFGSEAALRVPPTLKYDYLTDAVGKLQVLELGEGTALGMGIALASLHLLDSSV
ncbi:MAG: VWA domain-containing protein, partial [Salinispira sp.]